MHVILQGNSMTNTVTGLLVYNSSSNQVNYVMRKAHNSTAKAQSIVLPILTKGITNLSQCLSAAL